MNRPFFAFQFLNSKLNFLCPYLELGRLQYFPNGSTHHGETYVPLVDVA